MHSKRVAKAYFQEMFGSLAIYVVLLVASIEYGRPMAEGVLRIVVLASPMIGFGLMIWAIARHLGRIDEYQRRRMLEAVALGAAITAGITFTYGFFETAGYPRMSMFAVWAVLCLSTGAGQLIRKLLEK